MKQFKIIIKIAAFCLSFFILLSGIQSVLQAKWDNDTFSYDRAKYFYQKEILPEVVFIGSSQIYANINPLVIFQEFGIDSFDFTTPGQEFSVSNLYAKEAIKKKSVKVLVIDVQTFFSFMTTEARHRQGLDPLPFSINKWESILYTMERNEQYGLDIEYDSLLSYVFPILRYHDRWNTLSQYDFQRNSNRIHYHGLEHYHGAYPYYGTVQVDYSHYFDETDIDQYVIEEQERVLQETAIVCRENNVELLLIKTPLLTWRHNYYNSVADIAEKHGITYIDYNEILSEVDISVETDFMSQTHLNPIGAEKLSRHIGQYLQAHYSLPDHRGDPAYASWDYDWLVYQQDKASWFLSHETDWTSYLEKLQNPNYTIYMAARDSLGSDKFPELTAQFKSIGLTPELDAAARIGYLAIIDGGEVIYERLKDDHLTWSGVMNGHSVKLASESWNLGNFASIEIDSMEKSLNRRGINIVVYDNLLDDFVDCVTFDLWDSGKAYR